MVRYFTDGSGHVVRLHTDARMGDSEFSSAKAEAFGAKSNTWRAWPGIADKIIYTGDWASCTEAAVTALIDAATQRRRACDAPG